MSWRVEDTGATHFLQVLAHRRDSFLSGPGLGTGPQDSVAGRCRPSIVHVLAFSRYGSRPALPTRRPKRRRTSGCPPTSRACRSNHWLRDGQPLWAENAKWTNALLRCRARQHDCAKLPERCPPIHYVYPRTGRRRGGEVSTTLSVSGLPLAWVLSERVDRGIADWQCTGLTATAADVCAVCWA